MFLWLKKRRRRKLLAKPFPQAWEDVLRRNVPVFECLSREQQQKLRGCIRVFVAEKHWTGCGGLKMSDEIKVTVAGWACLLLLGISGEFYFDRVRSILVYPGAFVQPPQFQGSGGIIDEDRAATGEAWQRGPVILSWEDVLADGRAAGDGRNLVLHEFAHQIDALDGEMGGSPPMSRRAGQRWKEVVEREFRRLEDAVRRGRPTLLDDYGATNRAEFFAVATECFFEQPAALQRRHGELYDVLRDFYCLDPAAWRPTS
jgi:Mlc titration factor MtfA (ptsG expression regulator)